jgi:hypothetical protein
MTPLQRTQTQLQVRGQNFGLIGQRAGMETAGGIAGNTMGQIGGMLMGGSMGGMGGMMGGGMGGGGGGGYNPSWMAATTPTFGALNGSNRLM